MASRWAKGPEPEVQDIGNELMSRVSLFVSPEFVGWMTEIDQAFTKLKDAERLRAALDDTDRDLGIHVADSAEAVARNAAPLKKRAQDASERLRIEVGAIEPSESPGEIVPADRPWWHRHPGIGGHSGQA